jgi:hypothetical protein
MDDVKKVDAVRLLKSVVSNNTKQAHSGRKEDAAREKRATIQVLTLVLGRTPSPEEIALALTV